MNPYDPPTDITQQARHGSRHAALFFFAAVLSCVAIFALSTIDQFRESYGPSVGLALFASSPIFPALLLLAIAQRYQSAIWIACLWTTAVVVCFGLLMHILYAIQPAPREYPDSAGQMHIFFTPVLHWLVALVSYAAFGTACLFLDRTRKSISVG